MFFIIWRFLWINDVFYSELCFFFYLVFIQMVGFLFIILCCCFVLSLKKLCIESVCWNVSEVPKLGFLPFSHRKRGFRSGFSKKMALNVEKCDVGVENKLGLIRSATESNADEAVEALKAGKVIAVPTDTLYGFACDAWYLSGLSNFFPCTCFLHVKSMIMCFNCSYCSIEIN